MRAAADTLPGNRHLVVPGMVRRGGTARWYARLIMLDRDERPGRV